jgi:hypothetical protein
MGRATVAVSGGCALWLAAALWLAGCQDTSAEVACAPGEAGCACVEGGTCMPGLSCADNLCVARGEDATQADAAGSDASEADVPRPDASLVDLSSPPDAADDGAGETVGGGDAVAGCSGAPVGDFCPCRESADCASGFCLPSSAGGDVCTRTCDQTCPDGYQCRFVTLPGLDPTYLCVEPALNLCRPCTDDAECQRDALGGSGARCVVYGEAEGSFCGVSCREDADCPRDYACREAVGHASGALVRQCVRAEGASACPCSGRSIEGAAFTTCTVDRCTGARLCEETGLTPCTDPDGDVCEPSVAVVITFDPQGGAVAGEATRTVWLGEAYGPLPEAFREGYGLEGWRTAPSGGGEAVTAETPVMTREAHALFAAWRAQAFLVTFDVGGGSPCEPLTVTFGEAYGAAVRPEPARTHLRGLAARWRAGRRRDRGHHAPQPHADRGVGGGQRDGRL